jgi:hypothetical protein
MRGSAHVCVRLFAPTRTEAARSLGQLYKPTEEDLVLAGQILAYHARRYGAVRPHDYSHDLLIAIGAARTGSVLMAENRRRR